MKKFKKNCCDGIYNSFDVHFTSACDNKCAHCIDNKYDGIGVTEPDINAIASTILSKKDGYDDVLFLGGEPCLYLAKLIECIKLIKAGSDLKIFVTTAVPSICHDKRDLFEELIDLCDGINLSVQHHDQKIADKIRCTTSQYYRNDFYNSLPHKEKIRINLNIVKPWLYTKRDITACLHYYDIMGFNSIKISEIQHGLEYFVSFEKVFGIKLGSPYSNGCQTYIDMEKIISGFKTPVLLKRSCFMCEETLKASLMDGIKVLYQAITPKPNNKYGVVYEDGSLVKGWK
jgi:organic radical activating enzyme